ncbi:MAG: hypothetical protein M0R80_01845 [Proteobacteria bacterium]|nr:hypothetical protein [Pseudomonadota bacterium]
MEFKNWLEMSSLRDILKNVPQSAQWHPEGSVFLHTRLVRKALPVAVKMFEKARGEEAFSNLPSVSDGDIMLLRILAWLHDVGKASTAGYKYPDNTIKPLSDFPGHTVKQMMSPDFGPGKWTAHAHEDPEHYEPQIKKLGNKWQSILDNLSPEDKEIVWFVVPKHMEFSEKGLSRHIKASIGIDGKFAPDRKIKIWIVFKLMDLMGRGSGLDIESGKSFLEILMNVAEEKMRKSLRTKPVEPNTPEEFAKYLLAKGVKPDVVQAAVRGKFAAYI